MKKKMKEEVGERRKNHAESEREAKSVRIMEQLFALPEFAAAKTILFYASKKDEVQTFAMIQKALDMGKRVALPITVVEGKNLVLSEVSNLKGLVPGAFGVREPANYVPVRTDAVDLVIVPGVAFDTQGDRIGHGMGYYDKLLKEMPQARFVALAFELQMIPDVPEEAHDVRVHKIVTEARVIECK